MNILLIYILKYRKEHLSSYGKGQLSMKTLQKAFHGGDEYETILYEVEPKWPTDTKIFQYPQHSSYWISTQNQLFSPNIVVRYWWS
jgi:hypothetical protein